MEQFAYSGNEEYIWAMRTRIYTDDDLEWRQKLVYEQEMKDEDSKTVFKHEAQTKIMASLVPDEIIYNCGKDNNHREYGVCLLLGDLSGFTELCEKYNKTGRGGPSKVTQILNKYTGSIVQEIMTYNGDILKFSGDAFLAMWKSTETDSMHDCIHQALDCAVVIQKAYSEYPTDIGVIVRVKLAIASGTIIFKIVGDEQASDFMILGQPIFDTKAIGEKCSAGDILVCHAAWSYLTPEEYQFVDVEDELYVKVTGLGAKWHGTKRQLHQQKSMENESESMTKLNMLTTSTTEDSFMRQSIEDAIKGNIKENLKKFIHSPLVREIEMGEAIEHFTEMRQIVIVFINLIVTDMPVLDLANQINSYYKMISSVVLRYEGFVNKISYFDKDLMFLVLFGLRGFKHELESQIGLCCATECIEVLVKQQNIRSVSIGVTTGTSYCGVVGHTLRREYTVISPFVNKATRMMCAYRNRVTCDRETFLHSKLNPKNFILQESRPLKGIQDAGPLYEYRAKVGELRISEKIPHYPILGRNRELRIFLKLLLEWRDLIANSKTRKSLNLLSHHNTIIFTGDAKSGKCRLLQEVFHITPNEIQVSSFQVNESDKQKPYHTIRMLFGPTMGITIHGAVKDTEARLKTKLREMKVPPLMCLLNPVFNVNFEKTNLFNRITLLQKITATKKMIRQLCYGCFTSFWLIVIESAQNIDEESWTLLKEIIEADMCFIVMAMNILKLSKLTTPATDVVSHRMVRVIPLHGIDKLFHAGLACQLLQVGAIPTDLEKVIQKKSNGNPGWIENFLMSLLQGGGLAIKRLYKNDMKFVDLVTPERSTFERLTPMAFRMFLIQEDIRPRKSRLDMRRWELYHSSYRSDIKIRRKIPWTETTEVCVITGKTDINKIDGELSLDVLIMMTYDSLSAFQQFLLKCSSVIGEMIPRAMLIYVMSKDNERLTAKGIQGLFEMRVIGCAKGNFTHGIAAVSSDLRRHNPDRTPDIKCDCKGITIHETCFDLPKYASCGYFRFLVEKFHATIYGLLTDAQRLEFHGRSVRYLEKETRKCTACGNVFFTKILGSRHEDNIDMEPTRMKRVKSNKGYLVHRKKYYPADKKVTITNVSGTFSQSISIDSKESRYKMEKKYSDERDVLKSDCLGITTIKKLRYRYSLMKRFSYANFSNCQCPSILGSMYNQIITHCEGCGLNEKLMKALLEYAYLCVDSFNITQAVKLLDKALLILETEEPQRQDETTEWRSAITKAKIETLYGRCKIELGEVTNAHELLISAMRNYGTPFPTKRSLVTYYINRITFYQNIQLFCVPVLVRNKQGYRADYCDDVSECLALMCTLFMQRNMWKEARLAAIWSLRKALQSDTHFFAMCTAYANVIQICQRLGKTNTCIALEIHALRMCHRKRSHVEAQELSGVAKLYGTIFCTRFLRSEIEHAIDLGFIMLRISTNIHATIYSLQALPLMIHALIMRKRIMEAVTMLFELEYYSEEDIDNTARTWYYALCTIIHLETGYTMIPHRVCEKYYQVEGETLTTFRDPDAGRRYFAVMWLWCVRNQHWEDAELWHTKIENFSIGGGGQDTVMNIYTALYILEGLLVYMVSTMNKRNIPAMANAYKEIGILIKSLEKTAKVVNIIAPRFYHLKAYFKYIRSEDVAIPSLMRKAKKIAGKYENSLETSWLDHSEKAWSGHLSVIATDFWREHSVAHNLIDYHDIDMHNGRIGHYTLPMPVYLF